MPSTTTNRNYPYPLDPDPVDVAGDIRRLAVAVDTDFTSNVSGALLYRSFSSVAERDLFWPVPPAGAKCSIPYTNTATNTSLANGTRRMDFVFDNGRWWPRGHAFDAWYTGPQSVPVDDSNFNMVYGGASINVNNSYNRTTGVWTAPFYGLCKFTLSIGLNIGVNSSIGAGTPADYLISCSLAWTSGATSASTQLAQHRATMSLITMRGQWITEVFANATYQPTIFITGATGKTKTIFGVGSGYPSEFVAEYI